MVVGAWCPKCGNVFDVREPRQPINPAANKSQVGGSHYKDLAIQPWDYILANAIGYIEGCVIKYVTRWRSKGGVEDLKKARHFLDKLIEHAEQATSSSRSPSPAPATGA